MKIAAINTTNYGSTGGIMLGIARAARAQGMEYFTFSAPGKSMKQGIAGHAFIGTRLGHALHSVFGKITGFHGVFSVVDTALFCRRLRAIQPDILHLHNLHNSYINLPMLFRFAKKRDIRLIWTLHDCWAFTGQCTHYAMEKCEKWETGCQSCKMYRRYPATCYDNSRAMWRLKRKWFTSSEKLTLVTPSEWLAGEVQKSFFNQYPVRVIYNGIDLSVFRPTPSDFRKRYGIEESERIVLGVAFGWGERKGLDVFLRLAERLGEGFRVVLVGTDDTVDQMLPDGVLSIHRTENQRELAAIYTAADVFVNPTREEVFGLVNVEALACGTPVITFDTGGSPESMDETCGSVVPCGDIERMRLEILRVCRESPYSAQACINRAKRFDLNDRFAEYVALYQLTEQ